jgi:glycosyltransferase involved in cell wall biosynthesis
LRAQLEGREGVRIVGRVQHDEVASWIASADVVCQPSLIEPFGQSVLEAMACARTVVATRIGGPPEFVPPGAGVLVDPTDLEALENALRTAAALPRPNEAARAAAAEHDVKHQARRIEELLEQAVADRRA